MSFLQMCALLGFTGLVVLAFGIWGRPGENEPSGPMGPQLFNNSALGLTGAVLLVVAGIAAIASALTSVLG